MEILEGNPWKIAENRTLKWGSSPPPEQEIPSYKWLLLNNYVLRRLEKFKISTLTA
jgi:hypothetical protein